MSDIAIQVQDVSKRFVLGEREPYKNLRESLTSFASAALRRRRSAALSDQEFWALRDVSFEVRSGEVVGIVGRNGAGKSTLLKILSRIVEPTRGTIDIYGRVASLLEVGTGFHPELTGRENIYLNGSILGMTRAEIRAKFDEIVAFAGIDRFLDTPVKRYSSGMGVRLGFAVAAHLEPEILIVDEVLAVGDAEFQKRCLGKMNEVARGGRTVLFVSHNMAAVEGLCTKGVLLERGRVAMVADVAAVVERYTSRSGPSSSDIDLTQLPRNKQSPDVRFERLRICDETGATQDTARVGRDLIVRLAGTARRTLREPTVSLQFFGSHGQRVMTCNTRYQHPEALRLDGTFELQCAIRDLRLAPGVYTLAIHLWEQGQMIESLEDIALHVEGGDLYGTGKALPPSAGVYVPRLTWSVGAAS